ncbi:MAG: sugar ABC transporter ATP-binding protein [Lentisphaeria bacterium]|nr:sugar ABC transporter ATP-binding protein [Lentisphaeria bacterium]
MDLLQTKGVEKQFLGVKALKGVDFSVKAGEIHALMGENGAGKSTLIKIITGVYPASAGSVYFNGKECKFRSPLDAEHAGISTVYQEVNLLPDLSVAENICIGREPRKFGFIDKKQCKVQARKALGRLDIDINVGENLSSYSIAIQQLVAIARALDVDCKLLILDEPTSSLDENEVKELFKVMKKLREEGMAIIFITHFLDQVYEVSDRITILRDGQLVGSYDAKDLPRIEMVAKMIGKTPDEINQMQAGIVKNTKFGDVVYEAKNIGRVGTISPVDVNVRAGEQLGLAGLLGSGRSEIAQIIFGVDPHDSGTMTMSGQSVNFNSPQKAVKAKVALIAEDRKVTGIIPDLTIRENIMLALQASNGMWKTMTLKQQEEMADKYIKLLRIKTPSGEQLIKHLSGGNQQKVLIARWLATNPKLLILDEPTRGIDVGAKAEIEALTQQLCGEGMAVIFISSELEEVVRDCDRVIVLRDRKKVGEVAGSDISLKNIMKLIAG